MTGEVFEFGEYNGHLLCRHFNVAADQPLLQALMHFAFRMIYEEISPNEISSARKAKIAAELTIEDIQRPLEIFQEYYASFAGPNGNPDAVITALIGNNHLEHLNAPLKDDMHLRRNDRVDDQIVANAHLLLEDALEIMDGISEDPDNPYSTDAKFIACTRIITDMEGHIVYAAEYEISYMQKIIEEDMKKANVHMGRSTDLECLAHSTIKQTVDAFMPYLNMIENIEMNTTVTTAPKRPVLTLIKNEL